MLFSSRLCLRLAILVIFQSRLRVYGCKPDGVSDKITLGKTTYVCITVGPLKWYAQPSTTYLKVSTTVKADELSRLNVHNSWTDANYSRDALIGKLGEMNTTDSYGVGVTIGSMGILSYQKAYRYSSTQGVGSITFPLMMAIINVERGKVTGIAWDDDNCNSCDSNDCEANVYDFDGNLQSTKGRTCWMRDATCHLIRYEAVNETSLTSDLCELNVYIVWLGTDSDGLHFSSSSARFSLLSQAQLIEFADKRKEDLIETSGPAPILQTTATPTISLTPTISPTVSYSPTLSPTIIPTVPSTPTPTTDPSPLPSISPSTV
mmetsp:Transcript_12554/g.12640  ORF Transcript_12554/g.12640 Transcript_12554/m.12640 type:complete len:319 (-) Transcript_12554:146-1102(-)